MKLLNVFNKYIYSLVHFYWDFFVRKFSNIMKKWFEIYPIRDMLTYYICLIWSEKSKRINLISYSRWESECTPPVLPRTALKSLGESEYPQLLKQFD